MRNKVAKIEITAPVTSTDTKSRDKLFVEPDVPNSIQIIFPLDKLEHRWSRASVLLHERAIRTGCRRTKGVGFPG